MRFLPPLAALADGPVRFDGDEQAYARPMGPLLAALTALGVETEAATGTLPFTVLGRAGLRGGEVKIDASTSSQFVSGLLLAGARFAAGVDIRHEGPPLPSLPHIEMTVAMLRDRQVGSTTPNPTAGWSIPDRSPRWTCASSPTCPTPRRSWPRPRSPAGRSRVPHWPGHTHQPGDAIRDVLSAFGADVDFDERRPDRTRHQRDHTASNSICAGPAS